MTTLLIDFNHMAYRSFFGARKDIDDIGWGYLKHVLLGSIFKMCDKFNPDEVIIASDSTSNWRKQFYPEYKQNRKEARDKQDDVDWVAMFSMMDETLSDLKAYFPFKVLKIKFMEADDVIASIIKHYPTNDYVVVTSDSDYIQLLQYKNVKIYDAMKGIMMKSDDPLRELKIKIIAGDTGDNVPNILKEVVGDDTVKKRLGEKTAEKYVDSPEEFKKLMEDSTKVLNEKGEEILIESDGKQIPVTLGIRAKKGYKRNTILIDLNYTPAKLVEVLKSEYESYVCPDGSGIFMYITKNNFREFTNNSEKIERVVKKIVEYNKSREIFG